ncbi:hypothetical protein G9A89_002857 [Geosiphon pyriformis]|nr:hypothetical protein G9A89_002857 [Geosiphon pyriformis]
MVQDLMEQNIKRHYYFDGDLILNFHGAPQKSFKVHRNVLELSSPIFKGIILFHPLTKNTRGLPVLTLHESPEQVEDLLSFIYPASYLFINWEKVSYLLSLATKYEIKGLKEACEEFLDRRAHEKPLEALILADEYNFPIAFKESSKLVLDDFLKYREEADFQKISLKAQNKFQKRYIDYLTAIGTLPKLSINLPAFTSNNVKTIFQQRVEKILKIAGIKPSELRALLLEPHLDYGKSYEGFKPEQITEHFGQFENLKAHFGKNPGTFYIFIEL